MTELLLSWLNEEIKLSKQITDIPSDFRSGYLFAELLFKTNQLPVLSLYKNSSKKEDILHNLNYLQKNMSQIGLLLDEKSKNKIMNNDIYTSKIYLYKIKQLLSNKNINLEQLHFKNTNELSKQYNNFYFRNDNEKYLNKIFRQTIEVRGLNNYKYMKKYDKDKYNEVYKQIKKEYAHLDLNEIDMEFIMNDIKDNEYRMNHFKSYVYKSEERQKKLNQLKSEKEFNIWFNSKKHMDNLKLKNINKSLNKIAQKKNLFNTQMKFSGLFLQKETNFFENKLSLFLEQKKQKENKEETEELNEENQEEKRLKELKISQAMLANIRNKLDENIKNKKNKEKRERQKLSGINFDTRKSLFPKRTLNLNIHIMDNNKESNNATGKDFTKTITSINSTYSRLTKGDFFTNLIDNSFKIHKGNIKIGNRIHFFKTVINKDDNKNNENKLKLPEIEEYKENKGFNEKEYFEELNKEHYEEFNKLLNKKKNKKNKEKKDIEPIIEQLFDLVNYIYDHQQRNNSDLIEDKSWKEIGDKFKQNILLNEIEEEEILMKQLEEMKKNQKEEEEKQSFNTMTNITSNLNTFDDLYYDYLNYTGLFNDIIIPHKIRTKKYSFINLYSDIFDSNIDIKDYEPSEIETENLSLPKYSKGENEHFNEIITKMLEYKDEHITQLKKELKTDNENIKEEKMKEYIIKNKGKYFYLPIKMAFIGLPCSGRKTQGNLLKEKYPNLKIYNPEEILRNKYNEYKELFDTDISIDNSNPKFKNMKPAQLEQLKQELEEKKEKFKPILEIIQPYIDIMKQKESNENKEINEEDIISSIYMKLLIEELNKDFNETEEDLIKKLSENKTIFGKFCEIFEKVSKNKKKLEEIDKELNEIQEQKEKLPHKKELTTNQTNILKEQDILNKELISIKSNLFFGFIIINYPRNKKEALDFEKFFTGFELEYNKQENIVTKKLEEFDIINLNHEKNNLNKNYPLISFFDLFINFNIESTEANQRYQNTKYDPTTGKLYTMEELTKINDKKLLERLEKGIPDLNEKDFEQKKINYEKDIYDISDFYKKMNNGINIVYINLEQKDEEKKLLKEINLDLENSIEEIIINFFYKNIDIVINELKTKNYIDKEKKENVTDNNKIEEPLSSHIEENIINNNNKEDSKKQGNISENNNSNTISAYKEIILNYESFYPNYKISIKSLIYLMSSQRKRLILYLNKIQDDFIKYLNRDPNTNDIISLYIEKYNNIIKMNPKLTKNEKIYEELIEDISRVNNSIWVNVQNKKKEDINYLEKIRNNGRKEKYINSFMNLVFKIYQIELEKYLIKCETFVKYFLNKVGLLSNILGIFQKTNDEFLFKIDYKKYLFNINNTYKELNHDFNNLYLNTKSDLYNTLSTNETQFSFNKEKNDINIKNIQNDLNKLFFNSLKIIIRQENLNYEYLEKIKSVINKENKDNKSNVKFSNSKEMSIKNTKKNNNISFFSINNNNNFSAITSKSNLFKKRVKSIGNKLLNKSEDISIEDEFKINITLEKNNIKYRLMFLNCFIIRYIKLINECFDSVYNNMDDWITMNLSTQNNKLNEFITYLKRALNQNFESISMTGREFNYNDKYIKNKKYILPLYKNIYPDEIINLNIKFTQGDNFENNLVKLNSLNLVQQYIYNIYDLIELYYIIKEYGIQTCDYFVKYEIVKNIFINKVINEKKEYGFFYDNNINNAKEKKNGIRIFDGVCKRMKFYSSKKIDEFIKIFYVYDNKYININLLFTTLLIIGSELISSEKFLEQINQYLPNNEDINKEHIFLSLEEFMKINFWFENDIYLQELSDLSEQQTLQGKFDSAFSINQINNGMKNNYKLPISSSHSRKSSENKKLSIKPEKKKKINKIKETIFDFNKNNEGLFDINIFKELLDLLNNYCTKKQKEKNNKKDVNDIDIDDNDNCFRFSSDDLDEYIYMNNNLPNKNQKTIASINVVNNIFNNIFEK